MISDYIHFFTENIFRLFVRFLFKTSIIFKPIIQMYPSLYKYLKEDPIDFFIFLSIVGILHPNVINSHQDPESASAKLHYNYNIN